MLYAMNEISLDLSKRWVGSILIIGFMFSPIAFSAEDIPSFTADELKSTAKTYKIYCSKCHGKQGKGDGRMNKLYIKLRINAPSDFTVGYFEHRSPEYLKQIIREGGEANHRSRHMPPFKDELTDKQISSLVKLIRLAGKNRSLSK